MKIYMEDDTLVVDGEGHTYYTDIKWPYWLMVDVEKSVIKNFIIADEHQLLTKIKNKCTLSRWRSASK